MSAPYVENFLPWAVLGASILGSGHCTAMCGVLVASASPGTGALIRYHLGRLLGYGALGALFGYGGSLVFSSGALSAVRAGASLTLALFLIGLGVGVWRGRPLHLFRVSPALWKRISGSAPETIGLFSALLPCGWLHVFLVGAVATHDPLQGALYLTLFWMGTLPALSFAPWLAKRLIGPMKKAAPRVSAVLLIIAGLASLGLKWVPQGSCHAHARPNSASSIRGG